MIWIIIGFVVFIALIIYTFSDGCWDLFEKFLVSFMMLVATFFLSFIVLLLGSACTSVVAEVEYEMISDTQIIALKDNQNVSGNFYIMGGYVDEDLYYYYATETQFGYKTEKVNADNSYIKYTNDETHIEEYEAKFTNKCAYIFGFPLQLNRYIIYCPDGTVANEFKIDLE